MGLCYFNQNGERPFLIARPVAALAQKLRPAHFSVLNFCLELERFGGTLHLLQDCLSFAQPKNLWRQDTYYCRDMSHLQHTQRARAKLWCIIFYIPLGRSLIALANKTGCRAIPPKLCKEHNAKMARSREESRILRERSEKKKRDGHYSSGGVFSLY